MEETFGAMCGLLGRISPAAASLPGDVTLYVPIWLAEYSHRSFPL